MDINELKKKVYRAIIKGTVSPEVLDLFILKDGSVLAKECELWEYKKDFTGDDSSYLKTLKSIASFYNSYGGYIIYGVHEIVKDTEFSVLGISDDNLINQQTLRGRFDSHFGRRIDITYLTATILVNGIENKIGLLHVPQRPANEHSVSVVKEGGVAGKKGLILEKEYTYFRNGDECKQVRQQVDFEFVASTRNYLAQFDGSLSNRRKIIEHNLPDKNFICSRFIGRFDVIQGLWSWIGDDFQYVNVLAGEGGKGKTSIAYEFCMLIAKSGSAVFEQIMWATAKKRQFKALHNDYISTPETHYSGVLSLLNAICVGTGSTELELEGFTERQLLRVAKENLEIYPTLIVVDDVDSNTPDEQKRIMEIASFIASGKSRILLTTRINNIYSSDYCTEVPGLFGDEYQELIETICNYLNLQKLNEDNIKKLEKASEGSPLFTESIIRLYKRGVSLQVAIDQWQGLEGEAVREAALRKEVEELSSEALKILIAVSYFGGCSKSEIQQLTELTNTTITDALDKLDSFFLLHAIPIIDSEQRYEAALSVSNLVLTICDDILPNASDFIETIKGITEGLRLNDSSKGHIPEIGAAIRQCNALLKDKRYSEARETVLALITDLKYKENEDLFFMRARVEYEDPDSSSDDVRKSFNEAYIKGQRKEVFFEMWYEVEKNTEDDKAHYDVCKAGIDSLIVSGPIWFERYAVLCEKLANGIHVFERKMELLAQAYEYASKAIKQSSGNRWIRLKELSVKIVDSIWVESLATKNYGVCFVAIKNSIDNGDIRRENYTRLVEIYKRTGLSNKQGNSSNLLIQIEQYIDDAIKELNSGEKKRDDVLAILMETLEIS